MSGLHRHPQQHISSKEVEQQASIDQEHSSINNGNHHTMSPSHVLLILLVAILAAAASIRNQATTLAHRHPSTSWQCTPDYLSSLERCVDLRLGRVDLRGLNLADERERCCRYVRGNQSAADCLCTAFRRAPNVRNSTDFGEDINVVLLVCDQPQVPGLACSSSQSVTV